MMMSDDTFLIATDKQLATDSAQLSRCGKPTTTDSRKARQLAQPAPGGFCGWGTTVTGAAYKKVLTKYFAIPLQ